MKRLLLLLPLLALACGVAALPVTVGSSPTAEIPTVPAKKQGQISTGTPTPVSFPILCVSASKSLNLRVAPSTMAAADPDGLKHGEKVVMIGTGGSWYHIAVSDGRSGWVHGDYLEECDG